MADSKRTIIEWKIDVAAIVRWLVFAAVAIVSMVVHR